MRAVVVGRGERTPRVVDRPEPTPADGEALVRTLRVGIDGTDHEVIEGDHGSFPDDEDEQVLGHEAVGVVADANGTVLEEGTTVVPTVRRPPDGSNEYFERGEPDMAPSGAYVERGIVGAHGYMADYFTSSAEHLVTVPASLADTGFLVEPISNAVKAVEHAFASRSAFEWAPTSAFVLGNGPLGLLSVALLSDQFDDVYCLGRRDRPDSSIDIIERLGATYVDSRDTPVPEVAEQHEPMDLVVEATGHAKHAFEVVDALAPNGAAVLLGIPGDWQFELDGGRIHRDIVLENKALVGSVNSNAGHFEEAIHALQSFPSWFVDELVTGVYPPKDVESAFASDRDSIKTAVSFDTET